MEKISLAELLAARERRAERQNLLLQKYNKTLLSFTMNIAGEIKNSPLIRRAFLVGLKELKFALKEAKIIYESEINEPTGLEFLAVIDIDAQELKELCLNIEETNPLGRLFDMDIINTNGDKLSRKIERKCIICGKVGRGCASRRVHSIERIIEAQNKIMQEGLLKLDAQKISNLATQALITEVEITPKAGLVDKNNNGSHRDMNIHLFYKSAMALMIFWEEFFLIGVNTAHNSPDFAFAKLRELGIKAEKAMLAHTNGINTHKGAIFLLGSICGAIGRLWTAENPIFDAKQISQTAALMAKNSLESEFKELKQRNIAKTAGEKFYLEYGLKGVRGELLQGLSSVIQTALPVLEKGLTMGMSQNDAGVCALLHLIALGKDTTMIKRAGMELAQKTAQKIKNILEKNPYPPLETALELDNYFIKNNLSAGGCADLLAVSLFFLAIH